MPPQADLETLVTASDGKIACETTLDDADPPENDAVSGECSADDFPPGSFWLSKDAEYDWFEHRSYCYERDDSTKGGNYNSKNPNNNNNNPHPSSNSNSQRFSVNLKPSKAPIIGLPHNIQKATFVDPKQRTRCSRASVRLFPTTKRVGSSGKSTGQLNEPGSPKVSCMGRVGSKRCRRMRSNSVKSGGGEKASAKGKKPGFCSRVMDIFRSKKGRRCKKASLSGSRRVVGGGAAAEEKAELTVVRRSVSMRAGDLRESEPPGLGGMKRFSSGRRSCSDLTGGEEVVRLGR